MVGPVKPQISNFAWLMDLWCLPEREATTDTPQDSLSQTLQGGVAPNVINQPTLIILWGLLLEEAERTSQSKALTTVDHSDIRVLVNA
jgi:hypothetical protein